MKTIEFCGRVIDSDRIVSGILTFFPSEENTICYITVFSDLEKGKPGIYKVYPESVGQFTGYVDDNHNKIYEGNKVLVKRNSEVKGYDVGFIGYNELFCCYTVYSDSCGTLPMHYFEEIQLFEEN